MNRRVFGSLLAAGLLPARTRRASVETLFRSPGAAPNGLQAVAEGLWILDQKDNRAYLVSYADGKVIRALETDSKAGSGITFDGEALWIASTYSSEILRADAHTGKTLERYPCPGAGPVAWTRQRLSPLAVPKRPQPVVEAKPLATRQPTGAHGLEWRAGKLYIAVPPAKKIYRVNPKGFVIEKEFATAGDRPHGLGWDGQYLWCADSNLNAFHRYDPKTGAHDDVIQLTDDDPLPHGMTIRERSLWYCDDVGVVCRLGL